MSRTPTSSVTGEEFIDELPEKNKELEKENKKLKEENVQFLAFEEMKKVELKQRKAELERLQRKLNNTPRYNMKPNRLKNLRFRFISFFKG